MTSNKRDQVHLLKQFQVVCSLFVFLSPSLATTLSSTVCFRQHRLVVDVLFDWHWWSVVDFTRLLELVEHFLQEPGRISFLVFFEIVVARSEFFHYFLCRNLMP